MMNKMSLTSLLLLATTETCRGQCTFTSSDCASVTVVQAFVDDTNGITLPFEDIASSWLTDFPDCTGQLQTVEVIEENSCETGPFGPGGAYSTGFAPIGLNGIAYDVGNGAVGCNNVLEILRAPACTDPTKEELVCPDLELEGKDRVFDRCDLLKEGPVTLNFPTQTEPSSPDCAVPITVEYKGCTSCIVDNKNKPYCVVEENPDGNDDTIDFAIERVIPGATSLRFVMMAGEVKRACNYCVERSCGISHHRDLLSDGERELTGYRVPSCRKNGKCIPEW